VGLFDDQGNLIDEIYFGNQLVDVSYGRNPDAMDQWLYFSDVTPGQGIPVMVLPPLFLPLNRFFQYRRVL
jgi:hypothetical protein